VDVVTGDRQLVPMRWGLVPWWWSKPLKELRRCVQALALPYPDIRLLRVASHPEREAALVLHRRRWLANSDCGRLWDEWKNRETGERLKSCTLIVGEPNEFAADIHDRMPIFLREDQFTPWLSGEAGSGILKPVPNDYLQRWPVSKRVNSSKADADDATLIDKVELAPA
jgi:putative SOS response-associated peptidase YedK